MIESLVGLQLSMNHTLTTTANDTNSTLGFSGVRLKALAPAYVSRGLPQWYKYLYVALCSIIAFIAAFGNIIVSATIIRYRKLRSATNLLFLSLVTADLLTALVLIPIYIERFLYQGATYSHPQLCLWRKYLYYLTTGCSVMSLAVVCFDRMLSICHPFFHQRNMNKSNAAKIIFTLWLWAICYNAFVFYKHKDWDPILASCVAGVPKIVSILLDIPDFYLPGAVIVFVYVRIFLTVHKENITIQKQKVATREQEATPTTATTKTTTAASPVTVIGTWEDDISEISISPDIRHKKYSIPLKALNKHTSERRRSRSLMNIKLFGRSRENILSSPMITPELRRVQSTNLVNSSRGSPMVRLRGRSSALLQNAIKGSKNKLNNISRSISRDMRALKTIGMMIGVFMLCWLPTAIFFLYKNDTSDRKIGKKEQKLSFYLSEIFILLTYMNSAINCYLYTWRNKCLRKSTIKSLVDALRTLKRTNSFY